tara:strand:+ start:55476 stop:55862 length:387 start_codon:yes stop_codon:yes gene_type:complete
MSNIDKTIRRIFSNNNISQKVLTATIFLFFSGILIFLDVGGKFMYGIPTELILPIYIIQLALVPAYLKKYEIGYIIGIIISIFVAFSYRDATTLARTIPIIQYFLTFFSLLAYREIKEQKTVKKRFRD